MSHPGNLFHIGVVVNDLDAAMRELGDSMGLTWRGGQPRRVNLHLAGEDRTIDMCIAHSIEGPPRYELIQAVPNTIWTTPPGVDIHLQHVCYWTDTPDADGARYEAMGYRCVMGKPGDQARYFQAPSGRIVEVLGAEFHNELTRWIMGEIER